MAGINVNMAAAKGKADHWNPGVASNLNNEQQMGTSLPPPPPPVNTAILMNQVQDATRYAQVRLRNLPDAVVGSELTRSRWPTHRD